MSNIKKIHHVAMVVEDIERSLEFWRDAMGISLVRSKMSQGKKHASLSFR